MEGYELVCIGDGLVESVNHFLAEGDRQAEDIAQACARGSLCEVWSGGRLVAIINPGIRWRSALRKIVHLRALTRTIATLQQP